MNGSRLSLPAAALASKLHQVTEAFNYSRMLMDKESRDIAGEIVAEARALLEEYGFRPRAPAGDPD